MQWIQRSITSMFVFVTLLSSAGAAHARELCPSAFATLCSIRLEGGGAGKVIGAIMSILFIIAILVSLIYLIIGATKYITASGDQGKTTEARNAIIAALVGLLVALLAFFIVNVLFFVFTGSGINGMQIPKLV